MIPTFAPMLRDFLRQESAGGILLIAAAILALVVANSPIEQSYQAFFALPAIVGIGGAAIEKPLLLWINDGLMAVFFFLVGLEVKREVLAGQLSSWDRASLPVIAAIGGMAAPAAIFILLNQSQPANLSGWAIPAATDIAFALGILTLLGPRVPTALKALLLAIAVIDDIGAIALIAIFYTNEMDMGMLAGALATLIALGIVGRARVKSPIPYVLLAMVLWVFVLKSGVHATLAGVVAAMCIPMQAGEQRPLEEMEHALHPWVAFVVIPVFGFANAGVSFVGLTFADFLAPLPLGIALGLLLGKQIGIVALSWLAVKLRLATLPDTISWRQLQAVALLAAIGFTMSLFIGNLAFADPAQIKAMRLGVLSASGIAAIAGYLLLRATLPEPSTKKEDVDA